MRAEPFAAGRVPPSVPPALRGEITGTVSLDSDIRLLSQVRLFQGFQPDHLRLLAFGAEARTLGRGTQVYLEGTNADGGYVIVHGQITLTSGTHNAIVATHGAGSLLAEMALITPVQHAATAVAVEHTEVLKIPRPLFLRMLEEYPQLAAILQRRIGREVAEFAAKLDIIRARLDHATDREARGRSGER